MRLPVSAQIVEVLVADFQRRVDKLHDDLDASRAQYEALLAKYHDLRVQGAAPPAQVERAMDPVTQAIIARSRNNPLLHRHYQTYVAEQRAMGLDEGEIAQAILRGTDDPGM